MGIFAIAVNTFYKTKDVAVFSAIPSKNVIRKQEDFTLNKNQSLNTDGYFTDGHFVKFFSNNKQVSLKLNDESLELLKNHFGENDFLNLKDGSTALSGKAGAFVEGWYKDILYKRDFLLADRNYNGRIENDEFLSLKNSVKDRAENQNLIDSYKAAVLREAKSAEGYVSSQVKNKAVSVEDLLNESIKSDRNFDGQITRLEYAAKGKTDIEGYENWAVQSLNELLSEKNKQEKITLVVDPYNIFWSNPINNTLNQMRSYYEDTGLEKFSQPQSSSQSQSNNMVIYTSDKKNIDEKEELLNEFPEFRALIENNPHLTRADLEKLRDKKQIAQAYQNSQKPDLKTKFTQAFSQTDLSV